MPAPLRIAHSPCPNDTFVFHAWTHGLLPDAPAVDVTLADIDRTNDWARHGDYDLLKVSYPVLPYVADRYALLPCGGALGRGCGPLLLTRRALDPAALADATVAIPSQLSTAYLLLRWWAGTAVPAGFGNIVVLPFEQIMPAVRDGRVDAGLVIHEARFTYPRYGLHRLVDLGAAWETGTGLPIPLGAIVARRSLGAPLLAQLAQVVRGSVEHARHHPDDSREYVRTHAQELADEVIEAHIALYVNDFSVDLGADGYAAAGALLDTAHRIGAGPALSPAQWAFPGVLPASG